MKVVSKCASVLMFWTLVTFVPGSFVSAQDEDTGVNEGELSEKLGEESAQLDPNRIVVWCKKGSDEVRYASANIHLSGYQPCGELGIPVVCDASGNRYVGRAPQPEKGLLDCREGPRIYLKLHETTFSIKESRDPQEVGESLTTDTYTEYLGPADKIRQDPEYIQ